ncbi:MAG TPA: SGNH/GDSL hydrolase family protein [Puia sp.]|jgi:lysophospholipase L1-like esterase
MKKLLFITVLFCLAAGCGRKNSLHLFPGGNPLIQYIGRIDFSTAARPRFWNPGTYISIRFRGSSCDVLVNDEVSGGENHNYLEIILDNQKPERIKLTDRENNIHIGDHLAAGDHSLVIVKNTEAGIGWLEFAGIRCEKLLPVKLPSRKMECIGNSITCGTGSDTSVFACGQGQWYDQHNAWLSYGPLTARALDAQYHLTAVSGIGLIHSCCHMDVLMPQVFDKIDTHGNKIKWDFNEYQPDVVTICLGQNDGAGDSVNFFNAYTGFIARIRKVYPRTQIVALTSPMADEFLKNAMVRYLTTIVEYENRQHDPNIHLYVFSKRYHQGCGDHPLLSEHREIAAELTAYIQKLMGW